MPLTLLAMTVVGVGLGYTTSILVARMLGPLGFESYAVAITTLGLVSSAAEMGAGKQAMKLLPSVRLSGRWGFASGYCRYTLLTVLAISVALSAVGLAWHYWREGGFEFSPMVVAILFLPVAALSGVGIDFVMANHAAIRGTAIARLIIPGTTLLLLVIVNGETEGISSRFAVACFGCGSAVGMLIAVYVFWQSSPSEFFRSSPVYDLKSWTRQCVSFAVFAFLSTSCFRISILVLEALPIDAVQVALMAAAMDTGCLVLLLAKSTDKLYQPLMSAILEKSDWESGTSLRSKRYVLVGTVCSGFLIMIFFAGKQILGLYGSEFVSAYPALCFVSVGTCSWTLFSLAPAYLHFRGDSRFVFGVIATASILLPLFTGLLGRKYGATGASIAFCVVMVATSITFLIRSVQDYHRIRISNTSQGDEN